MKNMNKTSQSENILNAAYKCIASKGYANVSLREIANEAGVALSQLHYYFGSKKQLFREIIKKMMGKYVLEVETRLNNETTAKDRATSLINYFKEMLVYNSDLFRLLYDLTGLAIWSDSFKGLLSELFNELSEMIEKLIVNNSNFRERYDNYNPKSIARMIFGAMFGIAIQALLDSENKDIIETFDTIQLILE